MARCVGCGTHTGAHWPDCLAVRSACFCSTSPSFCSASISPFAVIVRRVMDAQADLQVALGWLRMYRHPVYGAQATDSDLAQIEDRLAKSLAESHKLLEELGSPMFQAATHPEAS